MDTDKPRWLVAALLVLVTIALYWPATRTDFVNYDDGLHVTANVQVQKGLTWESVQWALLNPVNCIWHPLTVWSHMLDCQLFGLKPWGHHLSSVLLHAINTGLVFLLLRGLTGSLLRSVLVAALFGLHPLHVESVAWVSERKDVLSGFFGLLSLIAYTRYAQARMQNAECRMQNPATRDTQHATRSTFHVSRFTFHTCAFYLLSLIFFALGLMSKPMLVTWPFVMLLLDYWPLGRLDLSTLRAPRSTLLRLVGEKIPFLALTVAASIVTFVVQQRTGALALSERLPLTARGGNTLVSYCRYLGKMFWPTDLAVFYPHPGHLPLGKVVLAGGLILGISVLLWVQRRRYPYLLMGWLWFCGTLVPVSQIVQTGGHPMADRYTYLPSLGVLILIVWGMCEATRRWRYQALACSAASGGAIVLCLALTLHQIGYWKDSETLFRHALAVTKDNWLAHNNLGDALLGKGQTDEAFRQFQEVIRLKPDDAPAHYNLGNTLAMKGQMDDAIGQYQKALRLEPDHALAHNNLGNALLGKGQLDEAINQYQQAIRLKPESAEAHYNLGNALGMKGQIDEAIHQCQEAIRLKPEYAQAHYNLGIVLAKKGQLDEAISQFQEAVRLKPDYTEAQNNLRYLRTEQPKALGALASTFNGQGKYAEAIRFYQAALNAQPDQEGALNNLAWLLASCPNAAFRNGPEAVRLATRACELTGYAQPLLIGTLAAAQAEAGDFQAAMPTAERAAALARSLHMEQVAAKNRELLQLYRQGQAFHEERKQTTDPLRRRDSAASGPR